MRGKWFRNLGYVMIAALGASFAKVITKQFIGNTEIDIRSVGYLSSIASESNKLCPKRVDEYSELLNVAALPGVLVNNYRILNIDLSGVVGKDADIVKAIATSRSQKKTVPKVCSTPDIREGFVKKGVILRYVLYDKNRVYIGQFDVTPAVCGF